MASAILLSFLQLSIILLCSIGISRKFNGAYNFPIILSFLSIYSLTHILPVLSFLIFGKPYEQLFSILLLSGSIFGLSTLSRGDFFSIRSLIMNSPLSTFSLLIVIIIRIATIPDDPSLVRGDIVSHIIPIIQWSDGLLGYPGVNYPRGFHGFYLSLSFGFNHSLVSHSVFITLIAIGWTLFLLILRNNLDDLPSSCVLLLAGGAGIIGLPDGIIENTGWWLVRQSNLQPEISAWVFVLSLMLIADSQEALKSIDERVKKSVLALVIVGGSTTNPFFFLVCSPFMFIWMLMNNSFETKETVPRGKFDFVLLISPVLVLLCSTILMEISDLRFGGTSADIHDATHRYEKLEDELGVYFTDGLNVNTIFIMLSPKIDLTLGEISMGKAVKLILMPSWFLIMATLFSNFDKRQSILYSATVSVLYLSWYFGIPAPDGWSVIRTQYPHRAFAMLLLVPLLREMDGNKNIIILVSSLFWLSLEPELFFEPIFRYEHAVRSTVACVLFLVLLRLQDFLPQISFELELLRKIAPMSLSLIILGFWGSFNLVKFPNSDFGIMFFTSITLLIASFSIISISEIHQSSKVLIISICLGVLSGHLMDLSLGNYHESSFLFCTLLCSLLCFQLMESESFVKSGIRFSLWILLFLLVANSIKHSIDPRYVTPLMIPGFPVL